MKKTLSIVMFVLLVFLAVACSPEHQHDYKLVPEKSIEATCTANGYNYMVCSCGAIQSIPTAALGHDFVEDMDQHVDSTCVTKGRKVSYCSRENCSAFSEETLPLDVNNHPYEITDSESDYQGKGVKASLKETKVAASCAEKGLGIFTKCSACGKTGEFEVVIPKLTDSHVVLTDDKKSVKAEITANPANENAEWEVYSAATAFVAEKLKEVCPTCGKDVLNDEEIVLKDNSYDYNAVIGTWSGSTYTNGETAYENWYFTVYKKNGSYKVDAYKMSVDPATGKVDTVYETGLDGAFAADAYTSTDTSSSAWLKDVEGAKYFSFTTTASTKAGTWKISEYTADSQSTGSDGMKTYYAGENCLVDNSLVGTASSLTKIEPVSKHKHVFSIMSGYGAVTESAHYVECDCGLRTVAVDHTDGCDECGYYSEDYQTVKITYGPNGSGSSVEFCIPAASGLQMAGPSTQGKTEYSWKLLDGTTVTYYQITATNAKTPVSSSTYFWNGSGEGLQFVLNMTSAT